MLSRLEPVRDLGLFGQEEVLLANRRLLLTAGVRADRSSANGSPDKYFFYPKFAASYGFEQAVRRRGRDQAPRRLRADRQPGGVRGAVLSGYLGHDRRQLRHVHRRPARATPTSSPSVRRSSRAASTRRCANGRAQLTLTVYQKNITRSAAGADAGAVHGPVNQIFSSGSRCGTGASRHPSQCSRCRARK